MGEPIASPAEARGSARRGAGGPSPIDSDAVAAGRRGSIVATLVRLGFIAADRAAPNNTAVEVLAELLPGDAEIGLCLTCRECASSEPHPFAQTTGLFANLGSFYMNRSAAEFAGGESLLTAPRRELVVCTQRCAVVVGLAPAQRPSR